MHATPLPTADLADEYGDQLRVCDVQFTSYGAVRSFSGPIRTGRTALLGDLMAERARDNGWAGVVIHGALRDAVALAGVSVGVQALGTNPRKSGKAGHGEVDVPVSFGGVTFAPGDVLHADEDGVVLLPASASTR
ncbi:RraA family protein [Streptomyces acidicola]|uniref:Putative 4-hydroxy-4-methyl-2-oxoglutarate aldolase n=1 Tax=Streptomyces acidicola TaxID=2596892 RepID=A0A5N8WPB2_9ACTN|nr:S-adenosylmethionine--2-demethylmenaquinone methyltransferase [Streptomyces acidicola]MPY49270.1 S-adenosylmethionine--2-demethylmenaquinone methyltransferase [Streptomyces acidicola]